MLTDGFVSLQHVKAVNKISNIEEVQCEFIASILIHKRAFNKVKIKVTIFFHHMNTVKPIATRCYKDQEFTKIKKGVKLCK